MINFYLVLFYVTLLMLSRQVGPGKPWRPVLSGETQPGRGGCGSAQAPREALVPGEVAPESFPPFPSPPLKTPVTFGHMGHLRTEPRLTGILRPQGGGC